MLDIQPRILDATILKERFGGLKNFKNRHSQWMHQRAAWPAASMKQRWVTRLIDDSRSREQGQASPSPAALSRGGSWRFAHIGSLII